eukprot:10451226-Heterocapsa_arctica.AAC.1
MFYRDYGNETYGDFLRTTAARAYEKGEITSAELYEISNFNNANSGNILEAFMGYAWIFNYKKDPDLVEFPDILNCLENGILNRMMEEEPAKTIETDAEMPSENMD